MSPKLLMLLVVDDLRGDATFDEVIGSLYLTMATEEGLKQLDRGDFVTHEEVMLRIRSSMPA
jgi:predicted transcriptional regulator